VAVGFLVLAVGVPTADAGRIASPFTVRATVGTGCTLTTQTFAFFAYQSGQSANDNASVNFTVTCAGAAPSHLVPVTFNFVPQITNGHNSNGKFEMSDTGGNGKTLPYSLCSDSACNTVYANGVAGPTVQVNSEPYTYQLFGSIPGQHIPPKGVYSQNVLGTLTF
jgi:spore coat protein U-like protein